MSRAEQVHAELAHQAAVEAAEAHSRRHGSVYHRFLTPTSEVVIYPLLFGWRVAIGPAGDQDDGGFDLHEDFTIFSDAWQRAEAATERELQNEYARRGHVRPGT